MRFIKVAMLSAAVAAASSFSLASAADQKNIVDTAAGAGNFTTLVGLLQTAGLADTLKGKGPFTVFAPDDAAFQKVSPQALNDLQKDKARLKSVLLYHVVKGNWSAKTVAQEDKAKTMQGSYVSVHSNGGKTSIDTATITKPDIKCSNGVIHVIDSVLMPENQAE